MTASLVRYYNRKRIILHSETVTPLFLGNARQEAEWRVAPFKALLRYWWRITQHNRKDFGSLLEAESELFGCAGEKGEAKVGKSLLQIEVRSSSKEVKEWKIHEIGKIDHPEKGKVDPLLYLAGMGIMEKGQPKHHFFPPKSEFQLVIDFPVSHERGIESVLAFLQCFGSIGARRRNGWGSFQIISGGIDSSRAAELLKKHTFIWTEGLDNDYPNCLGRDEKGLLLWQTKIEHSWWDAMKKMAEAYIHIRAGEVGGIGKLDPGQKAASERHLLGVPLTNHPVPAWGQSARHASPLHFTVRRKKEGYRGLILHLPFAHSKEMPLSKEIKQVEVWKKVHKKLDALLSNRAQYEDCL